MSCGWRAYAGVPGSRGGGIRGLDGVDRVALIDEMQAVRGWIDAREAELLALIHADRDDVNAGARDITQLCQQEANVGFGEAKRRALRATWIAELPGVGEGLSSGLLGTAHVDEICLLAERLPSEDLASLSDQLDHLVTEIAPRTPVPARKQLVEFEAELCHDDGESRLERQRRSNRFGMPKLPDGAVGLSGQLDPEFAEYVRNAVDAKVAEMWRRERLGRDQLEPPNRVLTSEQGRAAALVELVRAGASAAPWGRSRAEIIVHIDFKTLLGELSANPITRLGSGAAIPVADARRLACDAGIIPAVLGSPSQPLDVGRISRLATSAQRAALRAVHDTCCIAGCDVAFDYCEIHHISWWRLGGRTDLDNLVPVCSKHHHLIHNDRWHLTVDSERIGRLSRRSVTEPVPPAEPETPAPHQKTKGAEPSGRPPPRDPPAPPPPVLVAAHVTPMRC